MARFGESLIGGLVAAVLTRSFFVAAIVVVVLYIVWAQCRYGRFAETDRRVLREIKQANNDKRKGRSHEEEDQDD